MASGLLSAPLDRALGPSIKVFVQAYPQSGAWENIRGLWNQWAGWFKKKTVIGKEKAEKNKGR